MIVNDLKAELRKLGLPVSGLKAVLQERLRAGRATPNAGGNNNTNGNEVNAEVGDEEVPDDILAEMALDMHLDHEEHEEEVELPDQILRQIDNE